MVEQSFSVKNYSVESNFSALEKLVESNPKLWDDKYLLGTGSQLLRIIAAGESANGVRTLQALYESLLGFMQRRDSILGFAETMGYSAPRGSNDVIKVVIKATSTVSIPARNVVGHVQNVDLVNIDPLVLNAGELYTFDAKVGNLNTESRSIVNTDYKYVRFLNDKISDDVLLYKNDEAIDYSSAFKDTINNTNDVVYVLLTNAYGSVDLFIVNKTEKSDVQASDVFSINFIEYTNINYTADEVVCDYGTVQQVISVTESTPPASIEDLRVDIPYFRDTQREVLANRDPSKLLKLALSGVESTTGTNLNTVHSLLSYKFADYHLIPDASLKEIEQTLAPIYYFGFCPSNIVQPIQFNTKLNIDITLMNPKIKITNIEDLVNNILKQYEGLPPQNSLDVIDPINLDDIESALNKLKIDDVPVIKTASVTLASTPVTGTTRFNLGEVYQQNNKLYRVISFNYLSGNPLPIEYPTNYTTSGQLLLEKYRLIYGYDTLEPSTYYTVDQFVGINKLQIFRTHPNYTLQAIQPTWNTELGGYTYHNDLVWLTIKLVGGSSYQAGAPAIKGMIVTPEGSQVSYQLIGFTKTLNSLDSTELNLVPLTNNQRTITNLWNSYTVLSIGSLNVHV